jgi:hypothetical protein
MHIGSAAKATIRAVLLVEFDKLKDDGYQVFMISDLSVWLLVLVHLFPLYMLIMCWKCPILLTVYLECCRKHYRRMKRGTYIPIRLRRARNVVPVRGSVDSNSEVVVIDKVFDSSIHSFYGSSQHSFGKDCSIFGWFGQQVNVYPSLCIDCMLYVSTSKLFLFWSAYVQSDIAKCIYMDLYIGYISIMNVFSVHRSVLIIYCITDSRSRYYVVNIDPSW